MFQTYPKQLEAEGIGSLFSSVKSFMSVNEEYIFTLNIMFHFRIPKEIKHKNKVTDWIFKRESHIIFYTNG